MSWLTLDEARDAWIDAPRDDDTLSLYLEAARLQCETYAPDVSLDEFADQNRFKLAQLMQARALWQSMKSSPQETFGNDGYTVAVYPMDWTVKALLRPKAGLPVMA